METHREIIDRLGGIRKVAKMLGHTNHTTVQGWYERDRIPVERWGELIQCDEATTVGLAAADFMPADLRAAG